MSGIPVKKDAVNVLVWVTLPFLGNICYAKDKVRSMVKQSCPTWVLFYNVWLAEISEKNKVYLQKKVLL